MKQILKKFPSDKTKCTKNVLFFLSRAPTHHSFTFNLQFLYELKQKDRLSNSVFVFVIRKTSFSQNKRYKKCPLYSFASSNSS